MKTQATSRETESTSCINYEKNDYLYFFATKDGQVIYSRTYAEHQRVVAQDGSIRIPEALVPYMGGVAELRRN